MKLSDFKKLNKSVGRHFFSKDTMNFWGSKVEYWDPSGHFITSEDNFDNTARLFTLRKGDLSTGFVDMTEDFLTYEDLTSAKQALKELNNGK